MSRDETPDATGLREAVEALADDYADRAARVPGDIHAPYRHAAADLREILAAHPTPDASPDPERAHHQSGDECDPWCPPTFPHHTSDPAVVTPDAGDASVLDELAALELAEEVWEDEPTDAEQELMQRVLASDWLANHVAAARDGRCSDCQVTRTDFLPCDVHAHANPDFAAAARRVEWRRGWIEGEAEGQRAVIRQVVQAVEHLNPPDAGMGVFELVEWAIAAAREADRAEERERIEAATLEFVREWTAMDGRGDAALMLHGRELSDFRDQLADVISGRAS